jgi:hypothetical protein
MTAALVIAAVITAISAAVYLGLLLWGAIEDGRDQERRDRAAGR